MIAAPPDAQGLTQALGVLDALLEEWRGGSTETASAAPDDAAAAAGGWGDLPPELAAQLDGVDLGDARRGTLGQLAALLDAPAASAASPAQDTAACPPGPIGGARRPGERRSFRGLGAADRRRGRAIWRRDRGGRRQPWGSTTPESRPRCGPAFLAEAEEHLVTINRALIALEASPEDATRLIEVRRAVHTLKSASAAVGLEAVSDFCHVWEDALEAVEEGNDAAAADLSLLLECAEALERYFGHVDDPAAAAVFVSLAARLAAYGGAPREAAPRASLAPARAPAPPADDGAVDGVPAPAPDLAADEAATPRPSTRIAPGPRRRASPSRPRRPLPRRRRSHRPPWSFGRPGTAKQPPARTSCGCRCGAWTG